jgi:MFS superfamily sulfate permease-like transporter
LKPKPLWQARNEVLGGLVSAAVAIPLAMGFGMFVFSSLGENYFADGALAGLVTAPVVALVCVLLGDKTTTVYAPRVNSTFFLGILIFGLVHSDEPAIVSGGVPFIFTIAFSVILLGGLLQALFGLIKLGTFIKFTPQPVMAGFQNAAAALLFLVQLGNVCGFDRSISFTQVPQYFASIKPLSLVIAAITFATMWRAKNLAENSTHSRRYRHWLSSLFFLQATRFRRVSWPGHHQRVEPDLGRDGFRVLRRCRARRRFCGVRAEDPPRRTRAGHHRFDRCALVY